MVHKVFVQIHSNLNSEVQIEMEGLGGKEVPRR
jgi:hypothetical protein